MKLRTLFAGVGVVAAGVAGVMLMGDGDGRDIGGGDVGPVAEVADPVRAVRLDGECPRADEKSRLPAECQSAIQLDGSCLCLTAQKAGEVDDEVTADSVAAKPAKDRKRLVVCEREILDPKTGKPAGKQIVSEWQASDKPVAVECRPVASDVVLPNVSMTSVESGIEAQLRVACAPCAISAGSWGRCPHCILEPGGCAAACPVKDEK